VRLDTEEEFRLDCEVDVERVVPVRVECDVRAEGTAGTPDAPAPAPDVPDVADARCAAGTAAVPQVSQ
jgi:hypothetical protein